VVHFFVSPPVHFRVSFDSCAPAIVGWTPPARSCRLSWPPSRARWPPFCGRSAARWHPR